MRITLARALYIRHIVEGITELAFLIGAMRRPVQPIHLGILAGNAFGERIVFVVLVISASKKNNLVLLAATVILAFLLPFSSFFGHDSFLYHPNQATTLRARDRTSNSLHCRESTSPSTITSTGASNLNSTRRTALHSASGC